MTKVYPNTAASQAAEPVAMSGPPKVLTVWRKSLLFNGKGFTVFDSIGNLVFRVDNYASSNNGEIVLMDASGIPLLTIRRKRLSLGDQWVVYNGEEAANPLFCVKKRVQLLQHSKVLAQVLPSAAGPQWACNVEGSYQQRCCTFYDERRQQVAEVTRKEAAGGVCLGDDVFRLAVQPGFDSAVAMAVVIMLDQMFRSR